ncbi:MAG TPA: extracellular solute-binding protein, partial [Arachnia sp.]|nr:extracellular solute-binding protein [Arachnia sp.]
MNRKIKGAIGLALGASMLLTACGGNAETPETTGQPTSTDTAAGETPAEDITLTMSGWSLATTPEFQLLADAFSAANPGVTVEVVEYDAGEYNTLLTADLAAKAGPDIITQKEVKFTPVFVQGQQLLDVSDVALPDGIGGAASYNVDGVQYATPYRQDSWVIYYNKDLFKAAGVEEPNGTWTWDDYAATAKAVTDGLRAAGNTNAYGAYQHGWQSTVQGFANGQTPGADILSGSYEHLKPYYERVLKLQDEGSQIDFNTRQANQLTYQGEFGTQKAAMMPMGTWYVATLIAQQASGEAEAFEWGFAPAPQFDASTTGLDNTPVTFGDPTGLGINANIAPEKVDAAKAFLAFASSEEAAQALAGIGITPALINDSVVDVYFANEGAPQDDLSKFAWSVHEVKPENPADANTAAIQSILGDLHTAVLSGSSPVDAEIATATDRVKNEVGI